MKNTYYQISSDNSYYMRRLIPGYNRRVFLEFDYNGDYNLIRATQVIGFDCRNHLSYCFGIL